MSSKSSLRNWWTTRASSKKAQWIEKHLLLRTTITTDSQVEAVDIITMEEDNVANTVTVPPTEGRDLEVEAVIARGETGLVPLVGDLGQEIAARGPRTEGPETEGPDLGQEDGPVLPEEDRGIGNDTVPAVPLLPPQAVPVQVPGPGVGPRQDPDLGE